ncbi:MAG: class IV adenylate cyclase [Terriglobia bacterium]
MKHRNETEIKLEVHDRKAVKRRLKKLGLRVIQPRHFEGNGLFDFQDLRLWKARCLLRLRQEGKRWLLTYKGTPLDSREYKIRREIETLVSDGPAVREILNALGFHEAFRYEKFRTVYAASSKSPREGSNQLLLDETPIGDYLELEGSKRWIDHVARELGYGREDYITASYASLYRQACEKLGKKPASMVFEKS